MLSHGTLRAQQCEQVGDVVAAVGGRRLQEVRLAAVHMAQVALEDLGLRQVGGLDLRIFAVHLLPQRLGCVSLAADDDRGPRQAVADGPGQQVAAREDAAAEQHHHVHAPDPEGLNERGAVEPLDIPLAAEAGEGVDRLTDAILHGSSPAARLRQHEKQLVLRLEGADFGTV